ncbi:ATP-dependent Clp protease proteolytic subunit 1 [Hyella patelloides LEGE 07179]|uniref:ATP-dependent Clp protease proteolytic subunit n=1 Tax=Hyella patelloides LEGE 07179 TaxID=945734 RepID=A0A563VJM8_9CYAN|nr:ATP-dependent Clp protease proteolytic subunit [Hyella patelloides]VEP11611.1 ATP-dependent Clp protease proteolytic subunit 1 [Hyella patelloides LEGE 07179]
MNPPEPDKIPFTLSSLDNAEPAFNIYDHLLAKRIIFLRGELTDETANEIIAQLLFLAAEDSEQDIFLYINSSGGSVTGAVCLWQHFAIAIYDTIQQIHSDVCTVCMGAAASMGAILLSSGTKGKRYALPNARIRIQQTSRNVEGKATDIETAAKEISYQREIINKILAVNCDRSPESIEHDTQRDFFLSATEAKAYGLIDEIVTKPPA